MADPSPRRQEPALSHLALEDRVRPQLLEGGQGERVLRVLGRHRVRLDPGEVQDAFQRRPGSGEGGQ